MANKEHLKILAQGSEVWNEWRKENFEIQPDLKNVDFSFVRRSQGIYKYPPTPQEKNLQKDEAFADIVREVRAVQEQAIKKQDSDNRKLIEVEFDLSDPKFMSIDLSRVDLSGSDLSGIRIWLPDFVCANLKEANLHNAYFLMANFTGANLYKAHLAGLQTSYADFTEADLRESDCTLATLLNSNFSHSQFRGVQLTYANLQDANFQRSNFYGADLRWANLTRVNLSGATLIDADLRNAHIIDSNLESADLMNCKIYGISAWNLNLKNAIQKNLSISDYQGPNITVDNLEVAQFIYLLLNNYKIRDVINTITSKVVLILGCFAEERKKILEAIKDELLNHDFTPVVFDFEKPPTRDITETVSIIAHMARFVIADLTDAKSIPQELERIIPGLPSVPIRPLLQNNKNEYAMFEHFKRYPWVLDVLMYENVESILLNIRRDIIDPAETKAKELQKIRY